MTAVAEATEDSPRIRQPNQWHLEAARQALIVIAIDQDASDNGRGKARNSSNFRCLTLTPKADLQGNFPIDREGSIYHHFSRVDELPKAASVCVIVPDEQVYRWDDDRRCWVPTHDYSADAIYEAALGLLDNFRFHELP